MDRATTPRTAAERDVPDVAGLVRAACGVDPGQAEASDVIIAAVENGLPLGVLASQAATVDDASWAGPLEAEAARAAVRAATMEVLAQCLNPTDRVAPCTLPWRPSSGRDIDLAVAASDFTRVVEVLDATALVPVAGWRTPTEAGWLRLDEGRVVDLIEAQAVADRDLVVTEQGWRLNLDAQLMHTTGGVARRGAVRLVDLADLAWLRRQPGFALEGVSTSRGADMVEGAERALELGSASFPWRPPSSVTSRGRRLVRQLARRRPPRLAFSGIDGSGKTSHAWALAGSLERAGVPVRTLWNRPGFELRALERVARTAKAVLGDRSTTPALARQLADDPQAIDARSRKGAIGWIWLLLICLQTVATGRRAAIRSRLAGEVLILERHLLDAMVDVEWQYANVPRRLQRYLLRATAVRPDLTFRIVVDPATANARNPGDIFRPDHVAAHAAIADRLAQGIRPMVVVDGDAPMLTNRETILGVALPLVFGREKGTEAGRGLTG